MSCLLFTPKLGEDEAILTSIFFAWVGEKPPTTTLLGLLIPLFHLTPAKSTGNLGDLWLPFVALHDRGLAAGKHPLSEKRAPVLLCWGL